MPDSTPIISFVMPAFNAQEFLSQAVDSVRNQTIDNWELLIIDDGSSDGTLEIAQNLACNDSRIKVLKMSEPSGSAYQPRKFGIENAKASLISPLDADDFIEPTYLQQLLNLLNGMDADIVYPSMYLYSPTEVSLYVPKDKSLLDKLFPGKETIKYTLDEWQIGCNGGVIKKEIYEKAFSLFDSSLTYSCADELLTRQLLLIAPKVAFSSAKYFYRLNKDSITKKPSLKQFDYIFNNLSLIELVKNNFSSDSPEYILAHRQNLHYIIGTLRNLNKNNLTKESEKAVMDRLSFAKQKIDYNILKGNEPYRNIILSKLPLTAIHHLLNLIDRLKAALRFFVRIPKKVINSSFTFFKKINQIRYLRKGKYGPGDPYNEFFERNYPLNSDTPYHIKEGIICLCDGKIFHGGITDRLRGILTVYREAKKRNIPFYISWTSPFPLENYLVPNQVNWRIDKKDVIYNRRYAFPFFDDDETNFHSSLRLKFGLKAIRPQIHVYSNADNGIGKYKELFNALFKPSDVLTEEFLVHKEKLGDEYDAYTFRFLQLLGDFQDWNPRVLNEKDAEELMEKCYKELSSLINRPESTDKILITSDSKRFLDYIKDKNPRIYIVPGEIMHVDLTKDAVDEVWMKTFIDQMLLMNARNVIRMRTGKMYKSGYPRFAAEVGGAKFVDHIF